MSMLIIATTRGTTQSIEFVEKCSSTAVNGTSAPTTALAFLAVLVPLFARRRRP